MPAIMYSCAIEELEEAVDNKRPISSLMKQKWIDDAGGFGGDCETLLRLFCSESTDAWERQIAAYYARRMWAESRRPDAVVPDFAADAKKASRTSTTWRPGSGLAW
jgi:hypothetical protein